MSSRRQRLASWIILLAAPLVPATARDDWRDEWRAELAALVDLPMKYRRPVRRALGAFADAFWMRQRSIADFDWVDDVRHGFRQLRQHAGFAATAVGILGLGIAATVTMFSVTDQVLLRPLPYPDPSRIVTIWETRAPEREALDVAPANYLDWKARAQSFELLAGVEPWSLDVAASPRPEVWKAAKVTAGFFEAFGMAPLHGRFFTSDEFHKGRDGVLVLSESFWRQRYGGDPSVVGQHVRTDDGMLLIVGIAPSDFEPRLLDTPTARRHVWQPKTIAEHEPRVRGTGYWAVVGRLKRDVSLATAQAEMNAISRQLASEYPRSNEKTNALIVPLRDHLVGNVRLAVALLAGAVVMVLMIACVNVANLLLARGSAREREITIRVALGALKFRIVQQLLIESLVIALLGGIVGTALAQWALSALARFGPVSVPWIDTLHLDWRALVFALGISVAVALLSGILPAWRVASSGLANAGRQTSTRSAAHHRLGSALVVAEVALALVLITGAALLMRSFVNLISVDPGFQRDRVLVAQVFAYDHNPSPAHLRRFFADSIDRIKGLPAVQQVGAVSAMPFIESNINIQDGLTLSDRPAPTTGEAARAHLTIATPGYFDAMRIPLRAGRLLDDRDGADSKRVAVISDALARRHWTSMEDAIGDTMKFRFSGRPMEVEVVGVIDSLRHDSLDRGAREELFMPFMQVPFGSMTFVVRSASEPASLLEPVKAAIWSINPAQTIYRTATLDELVTNTISPRRFALVTIITFAVVALLLAIGGVYGVLSAITSARLREVGVRMALGAGRWEIVRWVLGHGLKMAGIGVALGLAASLGAARLLQSFLFNITPADPIAVASAISVMLAAAFMACYLPARRAAGADPLETLRTE